MLVRAKAEYPDIRDAAWHPARGHGAGIALNEFEERQADRRWDRGFKIAAMLGGALAFILTWGLQAYTL
jgi:hypothetical protein